MQNRDQLLEHLCKTGRVKSALAATLRQDPDWETHGEQRLVESGLVSAAELLGAKSTLTGIPAQPLDPRELDQTVVGLIPRAMAIRYQAICTRRDGERIFVALVDPTDSFAIDYIQMRTGYTVERRVAYAGDVAAVVEACYAQSPPQGRAPQSIRERIGQEVVRARSLQAGPIARPRRLEIPSELTETPMTQPALASKTRSLPTSKVPSPSREVDRSALALAHLCTELCSELNEDALIDRILDTAMQLFPVEACSLILIDWSSSTLFFREARGRVKREVEGLALPLDPARSVAAWCVAHRAPVNIPDVRNDPRHCKEVDALVGFTTRSLLAVPVISGDNVLGVLEMVNRQPDREHETDADEPTVLHGAGAATASVEAARNHAQPDPYFTVRDVEYAEILAAQAAMALQNTMAVRQLHNFYQQSLETLIDCYQAFDPVSRQHVVNVARLGAAMGHDLGLSNDEMETLCYAGLLHDIGKIKCAHDDPAHATVGAAMLAQVSLFARLVPVVRHHHERHDGTGTPDGLAGPAIPLLARILGIAEAWCEEALPALEADGDEDATLEAFLMRFGCDFDPALRTVFEKAAGSALP